MKKINNSFKILAADFILLIILIVLDQLSKIHFTGLKDNPPVVLINNVLEFRYLENRGAAFGMLQGQRIFFLLIAVIVFFVIGFIITKIPANKKYYIFNGLMVLIIAGAVGNTIDRLFLGYVRDFVYFSLIDFPIFNVADIYITVATALLIIVVLFIYKEEDLQFLSLKNKEK